MANVTPVSGKGCKKAWKGILGFRGQSVMKHKNIVFLFSAEHTKATELYACCGGFNVGEMIMQGIA